MPLKHVLYVDDEADIRTVVKMALEVLGGFTVTLCESGAAALMVMPTVQPDLILLDVMMPGMDGPMLLAQLQALPSGLPAPVIFLTAKAMPEEVAQLKALGAIAVLAKPFDPMTLADQLREHWRQYRQGGAQSSD